MQTDALTLSIFQRLMAQDTINPPGNERRAAECLQEIFLENGLPCEVQELGSNRANFICTIGQGGPLLDFIGHLDVVPAPEKWIHPKLSATEENGLLYGRGACDMKSGVAAMCAAAITLAPEIQRKSGRLRLCFVADEEQANLGMHAFLSTHERADCAILGEPTELHVAAAHRGVARFFIHLHGHAHHAALRFHEETAVTRAARTVLAIDRLNLSLAEQAHPLLPAPSIAVTQIEGYEKDNVVPGSVRLLVDFRLLPDMDENQARLTVTRALDQEGITDYALAPHFFMPGGELNADDSFARLCCRIAAQKNGRREEPQPFGASCEQCFLLQAGVKTVILGPGSLEQAHTVDEFVEKRQLLRATELYLDIAKNVLAL